MTNKKRKKKIKQNRIEKPAQNISALDNILLVFIATRSTALNLTHPIPISQNG